MDFQSIDFKQLTNAKNNVCRRYSCMPVSAYRFFFDCCLAKQTQKNGSLPPPRLFLFDGIWADTRS